MSYSNSWDVYCVMKPIVRELRPDLAQRFEIRPEERAGKLVELLNELFPRVGGWALVAVDDGPKLLRQQLTPAG